MSGYRCELCGKEFKTMQGLSGHKMFKHGNRAAEGDEKLLIAMDAILNGEKMVEIPIRYRMHPSTVLEAAKWISELAENKLATARDLEELKAELRELKKWVIMLGFRVVALEALLER